MAQEPSVSSGGYSLYTLSILIRVKLMTATNIERWHQHMRGELEGGLDELLDEDCVFLSPIVFSPQKGKALTKLYLQAAGSTFSEGDEKKAPGKSDSHFKYVKEVYSNNVAVLEFETEIDGKYINGVDIISFNDAGRITEFKVMIRPLQAVNLIHQQMKAMLERMQA